MKKEVVEFSCDNCPATAVSDNSELPLQWVEVTYRLRSGSLEKVELCADCREAFEQALEARRGSGT